MGHRAGDFAFYVLALSWHPSHCALRDTGRRSPECDDGVRHAFTVHGLWPQHEAGYPEFCESAGPSRVPNSLARSVADLIPDAGAAGWQWRKHGRCTGLDQDGYFETMRAAFARVRIPESLGDADRARTFSARDVEHAFIAANPGMSERGIALSCRGGHLADVRICMTRELQFRRCPEVDRNGCQDRRLRLPAAR
ncbi:ribonuclease T2 family protein [Faunimonas sp. B44]|uniref:ribonuclease T2 family protein n=1 Tax=Faunimonas sp. B44 TaxID=3461493 RepID=UPI004044AECA